MFSQSTELSSILEVTLTLLNPLSCIPAASERTVLDNCPADVAMPGLIIQRD